MNVGVRKKGCGKYRYVFEFELEKLMLISVTSLGARDFPWPPWKTTLRLVRPTKRAHESRHFIYPLMAHYHFHFFYSRALRFPAICAVIIAKDFPSALALMYGFPIYYRFLDMYRPFLLELPPFLTALSGFAHVRSYLLSSLKKLGINKVPWTCARFEN